MFGIKDCHKPRKNTKKIYLAKKKALTRKHVIGKNSGKRKNSRFPHIILFPSALGQERKGVEEAPEYLRDFINKKITIVDDTGDLHKNIVNLYLANDKTKGKRINVGGDHSMAIATIADTLNRYPDAKVIYFDAHADINTYKSSASKHVHGMPLAFLTGLDKDRRFSFIKNKLPFANLLYVGSRCWDTFEMDEIYKKNILFITPEEFNRPGKEIENALLNFVGDSPLHISFDVDSVDPKYISSTGTPVKGGILLEKAKKVLDLLDKRANIVNMDVTEWNPHIGTKKQRQKSEVNTTYLFSRFLRK